MSLLFGLTVWALTAGGETTVTAIYRHADAFDSIARLALPMTVGLLVAGIGVLSGWIGLRCARRLI